MAPNSIDIFGDKYNTEPVTGKYFFQLYGELFNSHEIIEEIKFKNFLEELFLKFGLQDKDIIYKYVRADKKNFKKPDYSSSEYFINVKQKMMVHIQHYGVKILYGKDIPYKEVEEIIELIEKNRQQKNYKKKFYMIARGHNEYGLELKKFSVKETKVNIEENYNDDFPEVHKLVENFLKSEEEKGVVLLHGKYGTGKTTYLRYLISNINKKVIYLPLDMMDAISSPSFLPFISNHKDSVLILEDCEELLKPRETMKSNNNGIVNLLNLGDGLLADALHLKIICTFNADLKHIDQAILRKGRLIARYEFRELEKEKAQRLSDNAGFNTVIDRAMTLAEIYNQHRKDFMQIEEKRRLGF